MAAYDALMKYESEVKGRARYGVRAFADALLVIPKTLGKLQWFEECVQYIPFIFCLLYGSLNNLYPFCSI